jgi:hypothetical protein
MKKLLFIITIAFSITLFSCQKDGVYNPAQKLKRIYVMYNGKKAMSQEWSWNKSSLSKIEYYYINTGNLFYSSSFKYDGNKIKEIQDSDGYFTKFNYNGNKYDKVEYYNGKSEILISLKFSYSGNLISSIEGQFYSGSKSSPSFSNYNDSYLTTIIPELRLTEDNISHLQGKGGISIMKWNFEYKGNNVSKLELQEDGKITTNNYEEYDKKSNPFFHDVEVIYTSLNLILSRNNVLRQSTRYPEGKMTTSEYSYTYDGNAPTEVQRRTNSGGDITISNTYYEYVK